MSTKLDIEVIFASIFGEEKSKQFNQIFKLKPIYILKDLYSENIIKLKIANNLYIEDYPIVSNTDFINIKVLDDKYKIQQNYFGDYIGYKQEQILPTKFICYNLTFDLNLYLDSISNEEGDLNFSFDNFQDFLNKVNIIYPYLSDLNIICFIFYFVPITKDKNISVITDYLDNLPDDSFIYKILNINPYKKEPEHVKKELLYKQKIKEKYEEFITSIEKQKLFLYKYDSIESIYTEYYNYSLLDSIMSFRQDTSSKITITFNSFLDIYEIFNQFIPSYNIPFMNLADFNKINKGFTVSNIWIDSLFLNSAYKIDKTNLIKFYTLYSDEEKYLNGKLDYNNYAICKLSVINSSSEFKNKIFTFELTIEINKKLIKTEEDKNKLIKKILQNIDFKLQNNKFDYIERISKGAFFFNLVKKAEYIDIPIVKHFLTIDDFISFFLLLTEQTNIHKTRSGERCILHLDGPGSILFNKTNSKDRDLYNFYKVNVDAKVEFKYLKLDSTSKYDNLDYPPTFQKSKELSDMLVIEFSAINVERLDISHLQNILNVFYTYMLRNKRKVIELYDGCL